jgi:biotin operon repressor
VAEFEANGARCFISRKELGRRINESEHTAERSVQKLIAAGLLIATREGRLRYLSTSLTSLNPKTETFETFETPADLCAGDTDSSNDLCAGDRRSVSNMGVDLCAGDTLTRSITRSNITRSIKQRQPGSDLNSQISDQSCFVMQWDESRQVMVRRKVD